MDTINRIIARSQGQKLKDLSTFKIILTLNLEEIKKLSQFRKQFPLEYYLIIENLYKSEALETYILDFLTGPGEIRDDLIDRFSKYISGC